MLGKPDLPPTRTLLHMLRAAGDEAATIVSERGNEIDSWELPDRPLMPLQVGPPGGLAALAMLCQHSHWWDHESSSAIPQRPELGQIVLT